MKINKSIILIVLVCAIFLSHLTAISKVDFFVINNQITYLGVLLGFGITLYTFGLSVLKDVYEAIERIEFKDKENKKNIYKDLKGLFTEIRQNVCLIFIGIIVLIFSATIEQTVNPFGWSVESLMIPNILNLFTFFLSTYAFYDILKAIFILSNSVFKNK